MCDLFVKMYKKKSRDEVIKLVLYAVDDRCKLNGSQLVRDLGIV